MWILNVINACYMKRQLDQIAWWIHTLVLHINHIVFTSRLLQESIDNQLDVNYRAACSSSLVLAHVIRLIMEHYLFEVQNMVMRFLTRFPYFEPAQCTSCVSWEHALSGSAREKNTGTHTHARPWNGDLCYALLSLFFLSLCAFFLVCSSGLFVLGSHRIEWREFD